MRKPDDKVIALVLLDTPVLSHANMIPKTRLLYQFYCINKPFIPLDEPGALPLEKSMLTHRPQRPRASAQNAAKSCPRSEAAGRIADNERSRQENTPIGER